MKTKEVYVNETLVGEAVTWATVYKLLTAKGMSFVGTPDVAEGPSTFFLRGELEKSDQSVEGIHVEAARAMTPTDAGASARAKAIAIARGLINTERAARGLQLKLGMLRLQCLSGGYYVARNVEGVRSVQNNLFVK